MVDGKKVITGTSVAVHSITKDGKYGVAKAVSIIKIGNKKNDTEVTLKKGKTAQITAIEIKKDKKKLENMLIIRNFILMVEILSIIRLSSALIKRNILEDRFKPGDFAKHIKHPKRI